MRPNLPAGISSTNAPNAKYGPDQRPPALCIQGCVDFFQSPNVLGGWALREDYQDPLDVRVFLDGALIGIGQTGYERTKPAANCGFRVTLTRPITMADIRCKAVKVYAILAGGRDCAELRFWPKLLNSVQASSPGDWSERLQAVENLIGRRSNAGNELYVSDGILFPPACSATDLRPVLESEGLSGWCPELSVAEVLAFLDRDPLPIPCVANREFQDRSERHAAYWLSGLDDYLKVKACWEKHLSRPQSVLDFGGATGRVFRHFYCQSEINDVYACDVKKSHIEWCKRYFPSDIKTFLNSFWPNLPFPGDYFDLVTAFGVLPHIGDFEDGWLLEISRILRPSGIAYITVQDEASWTLMPHRFESVLRSSPDAQGIDFRGPMPCDRMVFRGDDNAPPHTCTVFHRQDYIRRFWGQCFRIEEIIPSGHDFETVLVLRNQRLEGRCL